MKRILSRSETKLLEYIRLTQQVLNSTTIDDRLVLLIDHAEYHLRNSPTTPNNPLQMHKDRRSPPLWTIFFFFLEICLLRRRISSCPHQHSLPYIPPAIPRAQSNTAQPLDAALPHTSHKTDTFGTLIQPVPQFTAKNIILSFLHKFNESLLREIHLHTSGQFLTKLQMPNSCSSEGFYFIVLHKNPHHGASTSPIYVPQYCETGTDRGVLFNGAVNC